MFTPEVPTQKFRELSHQTLALSSRNLKIHVNPTLPSTMLGDWSITAETARNNDPMAMYREKRDRARKSVHSKYTFLGFISSGTYGRVYKVEAKNEKQFYAVKKFKPDKDGEAAYTGISQSAIREIAVRMLLFILMSFFIFLCADDDGVCSLIEKLVMRISLRSKKLSWRTSRYIWSLNMRNMISW